MLHALLESQPASPLHSTQGHESEMGAAKTPTTFASGNPPVASAARADDALSGTACGMPPPGANHGGGIVVGPYGMAPG